ncbi:hypothetical protein MBLNU459_g2106t2 [Dothideomycetes sp. NU459]
MAHLDIIACRSRSAAGELVLLCEAMVMDRLSLLFVEGGNLVGLLVAGSTDRPRVGTALDDFVERGGGRGRLSDDSCVERESRRFRSADLDGDFSCGSEGPDGDEKVLSSARFGSGSAHVYDDWRGKEGLLDKDGEGGVATGVAGMVSERLSTLLNCPEGAMTEGIGHSGGFPDPEQSAR